ncbi:carcinoembryonic antigen-related cell adhesion molecule 1-like [Petaurus breviceps papuanus]|uniref:carcinoembryonic antigen-related cell adhesion molecule 1-like n=1 Tax=Petaurus breviceps papuanus TaxID=3040969 RepID=UPI0036D80243
MESPSQASHSGGSPWKGLLLTASFLRCWIQPASAQNAVLPVVPSPPYGTVGSSVILDIQGASEQAPSYTWYKSTEDPFNQIAFYSAATGEQTTADSRLKVFSNGSLLISDLTVSDTNDYVVVFLNHTRELIVTAVGHLAVYGPLSKPNISSNNMAPVENKDTVYLTCQSENEDVTYVVWFINHSSPAGDRIVLSLDNRTLTIIKVTREDQGPYQCEIQNPVNVSRSDPFTLNITYGPDTPVIVPTDPHYPVGATLELSCSADSNPPAQYTWLFNGTQMMSTPQLSIPNMSLSHTGNYTCIASNSVTGLSASKDINITISEMVSKPLILANTSSITEAKGSVTFKCLTKDDSTTILWFLNNKVIPPRARLSLSKDNKTLTLLQTRREDAGQYQCEVWNQVSAQSSDHVTLRVDYGPDFVDINASPPLFLGTIKAQLGSSVNMRCQATSQPACLYRWLLNGTALAATNTFSISTMSWGDMGTYRCIAENPKTQLVLYSTATLKVYSKFFWKVSYLCYLGERG